MTWTAVGSPGSTTTATFTAAPGAVGNLIWLEVFSESATVGATAVSSSNATWAVVAGPTTGTVNTNTGVRTTVFVGTATSASSATATITFSGTKPTTRAEFMQFHSSVGAFAFEAATLLDSVGTNTWPAVAGSSTGSLQVGYVFNNSNSAGGVNGTPAGQVYGTDANSNAWSFNLSQTAGSSASGFTDGQQAFGYVTTIKETVAKVQTKSTNGASGTSITVPITSTAGNTLEVSVAAFNSVSAAFHVTSIVDSAGNTWTFSTASSNANPPVGQAFDGSVNGLALTGVKVNAAAVTSVTVNFSATCGFIDAVVREYAGIPSTAIITTANATSTIINSTTTGATPSVTVPAGSFAAVATMASEGSSISSVGSPWTIDGTADNMSAFKLLPAAGSLSATFTAAGSQNWLASTILVIGPGATGPTSTAAFGMAAPTFSATGTVGPAPIVASGHFAMATLGLSASAIEVITSSAAFGLSPLGASGSGGPLVNVSATGSFGLPPLSFSASGGPLTPSLASGSFGMAPKGFAGVAPANAFDLPPAAPPLPGSDLHPMIELWLRNSNTWLDVSSRVFYDSTTAAATIQRGGPDESTTTSPATFSGVLDNHDGLLSNLNPNSPFYGELGLNTPLRVSVPNGSTYMRLEATAQDMAQTNSSSALNPSGNVELWFDADLDNWYSPQIIAAKWATSTAQRSWMLVMQASGCIQLLVPNSAGSPSFFFSWVSQVPVPIVHGRQSIRVEIQPATGTVFFFTGQFCTSWVPLGTGGSTFATNTAFPAGTAPLSVGWCSDQSDFTQFNGCLGKVYAFAFVNGNNQPIASALAYADFTQVGAGVNSFADAKGNNWQVFNSAQITDRDYRFHGEAAAWPQTWSVGDANTRIKLSASGLLRRLGSVTATANSAMRRAYTRVLADTTGIAPVCYWPFEDLSAATQLASGLPGQQPMIVGQSVNVSSFSGFASSMPIPTLNGGSIYGAVPVYTPGTGSGTGGSIIRWIMSFGSGVETAGAGIVSFLFQGGAVGRVDLLYLGTGGLTCNVIDPSGNQISTTSFGVPNSLVNWQGQWSLEYLQAGSGYEVSIVFIQQGQAIGFAQPLTSSTSGSTIGRLAKVVFNPGFAGFTQNISVGHLSVQTQWTSLFNMSQAINAYDTEPAGVRFQRLCQEEGIAFRSMGNLLDTTPMGPQTVETVTALLQECTDSDQGIWYEPKQVLGWGFRTRASLANQLAAVVFDYNKDQLSDALEPTVDDQIVKNDVTASSQNAGSSARATLDDGSPQSIGVIGRHDTQVTVNVDNPTLPSIAGWLLWVLSCGDPRYKEVACDLANSALGNALYYAILQMDVGDRLNIINPPVWLPPGVVDQLVKGVKELIHSKMFHMTWNGIPALPWNVVFLNDPAYGRLDTDGSQLSAAVTATATTLHVATVTSGSPLWTTTPGDFPFNITIEGETMTVTAVSGTTSPQVFTVTRSVNGVVKSHGVNAPLSLLPEPVVSL